MDLEKYYNLLSKCEEELICFVCKKSCNSPVRLNKCGHYFCRKCVSVDKYNSTCPKCKEVYLRDDISSTHFFEKVQSSIQFFKENLDPLILYVKSVNEKKKVSHNNVSVNFPFAVKFADLKSFKRNSKGESKLHLACKRKSTSEVRQLIKNNVDINLKDYASWTPLHEAIQAEAVDVVTELLDKGALINSPGEFYITPLHKAVIIENPDLIKLLVEYGADKEAIDFYGRKPIDCTKRRDLLNVINNTEVKKNVEICVYLPNKVVAYCHSIDDEYKSKIASVKDVTVCHEFDMKKQVLTHLVIKKSHKVSLKILLSMISGLIIVPQEWINDYVKGEMNLPTEPLIENNSQLSAGIRKALVNRLMNKPKLFDGIKFFIDVAEETLNIYELLITKDFLRLLISVGGGEILCRAPAPRTIENFVNFPYHASSLSSVCGCTNIIVFHDKYPPMLQYKMKELQHKPATWLIDSVINFCLI
ncbi:hypothetical protein WA026_013584 [Henosepilachna vigintioctopunctata]|uniref:RING-type domain-containing protein n=1 Tax=Henosepilachna vigintioctopunctata TaxID=420089 RepID=A0AAW1VF70_9CUCU